MSRFHFSYGLTPAVSLFILLVLSILPTSAQTLPASAARPYCTDQTSFVLLPDGTCLNLSYLTYRGQAQQELGGAMQNFSQAVELNTVRPATYSTTTGVGNTFVSRSATYSESFTPGLQEAREQVLEDRSNQLLEAGAYSEGIDRLTFPIHTEAMSIISGTLAR